MKSLDQMRMDSAHIILDKILHPQLFEIIVDYAQLSEIEKVERVLEDVPDGECANTFSDPDRKGYETESMELYVIRSKQTLALHGYDEKEDNVSSYPVYIISVGSIHERLDSRVWLVTLEDLLPSNRLQTLETDGVRAFYTDIVFAYCDDYIEEMERKMRLV